VALVTIVLAAAARCKQELQMPRGCFVVSRDGDNPRDIRFSLLSGTDTVPDEQLRLRDEVDGALTVLRMLFTTDDTRFEEYFRPLLSLAQAGLVGDSAQPELGLRALVSLKNDITAREAGRVKNQYMKVLGQRALVAGLPALAAGFAMPLIAPDLPALRSFLLLWSGCMAGVWLSFGARKTVFTFEDLNIPEQDRMEPLVRLVFAGLLTMVIGLLFETHAMEITLGAIKSSDFGTRPTVALLIGMLSGFSEKVLSSQVGRQASALLAPDR
jgi:hypothetical protein